MKCGDCICVRCEEEFGINKGECSCCRCEQELSGDGIGYCKRYREMCEEPQITFMEGLE